jgi:hypothetical protein
MTEQEWLTWDEDPVEMLYVLEDAEGKASARKLRLFAVGCCRGIGHLLTEEISRRAAEVAESFADGQTTFEELQAVRSAAEQAGRVVYDAAFPSQDGGVRYWVSRAACLTCDLMGLAAMLTQEPFQYCHQAQDASDAVRAVVGHSATPTELWGTGEGDLAYERATEGERARYCDLLREVFGNPFHPVSFDLTWRTPQALALARTAYEERRFEDLPLLADALEEAGCTAEDILSHVRGPGPHVRGCWALDLVLGRS